MDDLLLFCFGFVLLGTIFGVMAAVSDWFDRRWPNFLP
jgi:hypothetical protein